VFRNSVGGVYTFENNNDIHTMSSLANFNTSAIVAGHVLYMAGMVFAMKRDAMAIVALFIWLMVFLPLTTLTAYYAPEPATTIVACLYAVWTLSMFAQELAPAQGAPLQEEHHQP
jgi:hypothetical protein